MGALAQIKPSRFSLFRAIVSPQRPPIISSRAVPVREPHAFPETPTRPTLPLSIRDEMLEEARMHAKRLVRVNRPG